MARIVTDPASDFAATRETSWEVARAILEMVDFDEEKAQRIWEAPTSEEMNAVIARAWVLARDEEHFLFWGQETLARTGEQSP